MELSAKNYRTMTGAIDISTRPVGRRFSASRGRVAVPAVLLRWAEQETGRFILWSPVLMALGIALYFALPREPDLAAVMALAVLPGAVWAVAARFRHPAALAGRVVSRAVFFVALGATLATCRTAMVEGPVLPRDVGPAPIEGTLLAREDRPGDQRLTIEPEMIGGLTEDQRPRKVRVTWRGAPTDAGPGDRVRVFGQLMPPPGPAVPGGFDYGRQLYYEGIGGVGFLYAEPRIISRSVRPPLSTRIEQWRGKIAGRIERLTPSPAAPVMAALVTGQRDGIPPEVTDALRDTGMAHLLAISGLHMGLVCGVLFFSLRFLFACHPGWAARYPIKKWAAIGGLLGGTAYLALSGAPVSAQRAYIMAVIGFLAILADRRAISLRNVALAALVIIVLTPEAVMSAGFQMSFAAVTALVAAYDLFQGRGFVRDRGMMGRAGIFIGALFLTSFIAGLATSPMAIFHFNRIASYGLPVNMAVMPLFTLIVMPGAVLGLILMPLGLDVLVWPVVGRALNLILGLTEWVAGHPGAVMQVPQWSGAAWGLVMAGMLFLCLLKAPWRWAGAAVITGGVLLAPFSPRPVLMIAEDMANIGAMGADGQLRLEQRRGGRFTVDQWRQMYGITDERRDLETFPCGEVVCPVPVKGLSVLYAEDLASAASACRRAQIVIWPVWDDHGLGDSCAARLITEETVGQSGPVSVFQRQGAPVFREGNPMRGDRPWRPSVY